MPLVSKSMFVPGRYEPELKAAVGLALEAGRILLAEFLRPGGPRGRDGHCPADREAESMIRAGLKEHFPLHGRIGEELSGENRESRDPEGHVWLIDPNDGTSGFQQGWRGAAVSLALLRAGLPVLGVVHAYGTRAGKGELFAWAEGQPWTWNGEPVPEGPVPNTILVSQSADPKALEYAGLCQPARFMGLPGIAYRLALAASGRGLAAVSAGAPVPWDVAGGHALLIRAKKPLLSMPGTPVTYQEDGQDRVGDCVGGDPAFALELAGRDWSSLDRAQEPRAEPYPLVTPSADLIFNDPEVLARAQGCLLGQIAGDNLGALVEFRTAAAIAQGYPEGPNRLTDGGTWNLLAGQPTDDSELALMLARSMVAGSGYDPEEAARAYAWWYRSRPFDIGATTATTLSAAMRAMESGKEAAPAARKAAAAYLQSQANGALMRISPLALWGYRMENDRLADLARQDAVLTHAHPVCQDANAVFCLALAATLRGEGDRETIFRQTLDWAKKNRIHETVVETMVQSPKAPPEDFQTHMGWVLIALKNAFYQFLHASDAEEGVVRTVRAGGDTDTNGAIAGALLGAWFGVEGLPDQWVDRVLTCRPIPGLEHCGQPRPAPFWPVDALHLAERLVRLGANPT